MIPVLQPGALGQELADCAVLGAVIGAVRAEFPVRGSAAFLPDFLAVGAALFAAQSYAAGQSSAGVLRWYMLVAAFAASAATAQILGVPLRAVGRSVTAAGRSIRRFLPEKPKRIPAKKRKGNKTLHSEKRNEEKSKKSLPKQRLVLYNSNVSK